MSYVEVRAGDEKRKHSDYVDIALKELKRKLKRDDLFQELKRREFYLPPSARKKSKHKEALKRKKRDERKQEWVSRNGDAAPVIE